MIYTENPNFHKRGTALLLLVAAVLYVLPMAVLPIRSGEARMAYLANKEADPVPAKGRRSLLNGKSPYALISHGIYHLSKPLDPARHRLDATVRAEGEPPGLPALSPVRAKWSVRLPLLLGLALLILPCAHVIASEVGKVEGYLVAGMTLTCWPLIALGNIEKRIVVLAGLVNCAWFMWYHYGRCHKNWDRAWAAAGIFMLLACLEGGTLMLIVFYLPIIFLRRPFRIWQRMLNPVHLVTLAAILIFSIFWAHFSHAGEAVEAIRRGYGGGQAAGLSLLARLLLFPLALIALYLPWPGLSWPAYCAAYRPLEKSTGLSHFLRTLTVPLFLAAWLLPGFPKFLMVCLVPPIACLTAIHYRLLVRRHIGPLRKLSSLLRRLTVAACGVLLLALALHVTDTVYFDGVKSSTVGWAVVLCTLSLLALVFARRCKRWAHFWVEIMLVTGAAGCLALGVSLSAVDFLRRDVGMEAADLVHTVPETEPVFLLQRGGVATTAYHTRRRIIPIADPTAIPQRLRIAYVWGNGKPPLLETRKWERISQAYPTERAHAIVLERQTDRRFSWRVDVTREEQPGREDLMRMYRGVLDPEMERLLAP